MRIEFLLSWIVLLLSPAVRAAVLAIDYGSEFTKLSLVKPGIPFDVILDRDSKRKIQSVVGWKRDDRVFGQEGKMAATRFPDTHFPYVKPLIGSTALSQLPLYPSNPRITPEGSIIFPHPEHPDHISPSPSSAEEVWTPTALLAHQIAYFRQLAEDTHAPGQASNSITQVVVTVPSWWNQYQRKAYKDALELQGLTCLAMINEGTGVALNYAMTRTFPDYDPITGEGEKEYHVIYDSGSMATTASVIAFYQTSVLPTPKSKTPVNTTHIENLGSGHEAVGGLLLDLALQEMLVQDFIKTSGAERVRQDKRAMAKLLREANRVKHILSANQESGVNIESLHNDIDFRTKVSRAKLEEAIVDAAPLFASPLINALEVTGMNMSSISSIIMFGGNTRVPLVQNALKEVLDPKDADKIAQNVNTDEAAVLGAAYYGASLSKMFKMKSIDIKERSSEVFTVNGEVLFPAGSVLGQKKTLTLDPRDAMSFDFTEGSKSILHLDIVDLQDHLANFTAPSPVVNITIRLDSRGYLATSNVVLVSNVTEAESGGGVAGALKGLFGKKDKNGADSEDADAEKVDEADAAAAAKEAEAKPKPKTKAHKVALKFREKSLGVKPMSGEEKRTTLARLNSIAAYEQAKTQREEARNLLEGYLYRLSGLLSSDTDNKALFDYGTEKERKALKSLLDETFEWLAQHAEKAEHKLLVAKRTALEKLEQPVIFRFRESQTRGKAVADFQQAMFAARGFLVEATKNVTEAKEAMEESTPENPVAPPKYTDEELKVVEDMLKDNEVWMDTRMEKQVKIESDKTSDPEILTEDLNTRGKSLQMTVLRLEKKKAPRAPKPVTSKSTSSTSATASEETAEPSATNDAEPTTTSSEIVPTQSEDAPPIHEEL